MKKAIFTTRSAKIWIDNDNIIHAVIAEKAELNLEDAIENMKIIDEIANGISKVVLSDIRLAKSATKEHRDYFTTKEVSQKTTASALLVKSPLSKVIGNLFLKITKPHYRLRIFTTEKEAILWLKKYANK